MEVGLKIEGEEFLQYIDDFAYDVERKNIGRIKPWDMPVYTREKVLKRCAKILVDLAVKQMTEENGEAP